MKRISVAIGNSTVKAALFEELELVSRIVWTHADCMDEDRLHGDLVSLAGGEGVPSVVCSVVPALTPVLRKALERFGSEVVEVDTRSGALAMTYRTPETLGADRYSAALAAKETYGAPVIVVDCGTALTVNVVDAAGRFIGGSISPGFGTALRMMSEGTAQLPLLEADADVPVIGRDTAGSMRSGVVHVLRKGIAGMVTAIKNQTGHHTPIILTGGDAEMLAGALEGAVMVDENIVLRGGIFYLLSADRT